MPTYAELTAELLVDAASLFKSLASDNESLQQEMLQNAGIYENLARLLMESPGGAAPSGQTYAALAGKLLRDTAVFFRKLASQNEPVREQMEYNADVYDQIGASVVADPLGIME